ncbi:VanZ family protein [Maribacter chungangensis]|uniref:VanZ family protein n=1 Tax=Maribacter chungangensis TaxID=1069117 RepID=A0ABW3B131_9FLAO
MANTFLFRILFVSWLVFITFASLFSFTGTMAAPRINIPHIDKIVHFTFYFVLVVLGVKAVSEITRTEFALKKVLWCSFLFAVVYGILIELLQYGFTQDRHGDILDVFANSAGALVGVFLVKRLVSKDWGLK